MNTFATIEEARRFDIVTYYTVRMEGEEHSLFLQFLQSCGGNAELEEDMYMLRSWMEKLGNEIGAKEQYFRFEAARGGDARALPPRHLNLDNDLRLYCMRINEKIVVLFSGAVKTADTAQDCPQVYPHFSLANRLCKSIQRAITEREIIISEDEDQLIFESDFELEI